MDPKVNLGIAVVEHQRGNLRQAILYYQKVLATSKDDAINAQALANMGHAYSALGDTARAKECYVQAGRIHPAAPRQRPRATINWRGQWWLDVGPFIRDSIHEWKSKHISAD